MATKKTNKKIDAAEQARKAARAKLGELKRELDSRAKAPNPTILLRAPSWQIAAWTAAAELHGINRTAWAISALTAAANRDLGGTE